MSEHRSITISGDPGSGKSTVATELARRLGLRKVSVGDIHRATAESQGLTEQQMNSHPERSAEVDRRVDAYQRDLARSGETLVIDSRLGWHFFPGAYKVQLHSDPLTASRRVLGRTASKAEAYSSLGETLLGLRERSDMERARFISTYGVDKARLDNYDLTCDTTSATPGEVADVIVTMYHAGPAGDVPALFLDPDRIQLGAGSEASQDTTGIRVTYTGACFVLMAGRTGLAEALHRGDSLIRASLVADPPRR